MFLLSFLFFLLRASICVHCSCFLVSLSFILCDTVNNSSCFAHYRSTQTHNDTHSELHDDTRRNKTPFSLSLVAWSSLHKNRRIYFSHLPRPVDKCFSLSIYNILFVHLPEEIVNWFHSICVSCDEMKQGNYKRPWESSPVIYIAYPWYSEYFCASWSHPCASELKVFCCWKVYLLKANWSTTGVYCVSVHFTLVNLSNIYCTDDWCKSGYEQGVPLAHVYTHSEWRNERNGPGFTDWKVNLLLATFILFLSHAIRTHLTQWNTWGHYFTLTNWVINKAIIWIEVTGVSFTHTHTHTVSLSLSFFSCCNWLLVALINDTVSQVRKFDWRLMPVSASCLCLFSLLSLASPCGIRARTSLSFAFSLTLVQMKSCQCDFYCFFCLLLFLLLLFDARVLYLKVTVCLLLLFFCLLLLLLVFLISPRLNHWWVTSQWERVKAAFALVNTQ